ncbi:MAG: FABP family protein [Chloroflexi bacterium]|nr:MAG: FABP family protein [Chloroflexota bacterium]TMD81975.1 MAG: FABP family protein [Chloroflexota bacterium]
MIGTDLNPALTPVAFLLGTWRGEGEGQFPTIRPFRYREEIRFTHNGKAFLIYTQRTEAIDSGQPMHGEAGYLRLVGDGRVEFVIAQPIGFAEISLGRVDGMRIDVECASVGRTPTAKPVTSISRSLWLDDETLRYELKMGMEGAPLAQHLRASFHRSD